MRMSLRGRIATIVCAAVFAILLPFSGVWAAPNTTTESKQTAASLVNLNTATQAELEALPGIGEVSAKKIIAGRPYASVADLSAKAGLSADLVKKISGLVTVSGKASTTTSTVKKAESAAAPKTTATTTAKTTTTTVKKTASTSGTSAPAAKTTTTTVKKALSAAASVPSPGKGLVWANSDSKIYHREGSHWYGKTKQGSYMTEAEAIKQGYRAAKNDGTEQ